MKDKIIKNHNVVVTEKNCEVIQISSVTSKDTVFISKDDLKKVVELLYK